MTLTRNQPVDGIARERFPTASNGPGREQVAEIQCARMLAAMREVCAELGTVNVTVAHVVERAGVSRRTFYQLFSDLEACFLAALEQGLVQIASRVVAAYERPGHRWRERIREALVELLSALDEDRATGRFVIVETLEAGRVTFELRRRVLDRVIDAVDEGRIEHKPNSFPSRLTAEGVVGAVLSVLHGRLLEEDREPLLGLANPLMSMVVLPYLGSTAARRELSRPLPSTSHPVMPGVASNPLRELDMRLTYRTIRVLLAVAASTGGSNRVVGEAAGISDQGQISKLLSRLEKLGLVSNAGLGSGRGVPNAWTLTERGKEVRCALAGQVGPP